MGMLIMTEAEITELLQTVHRECRGPEINIVTHMIRNKVQETSMKYGADPFKKATPTAPSITVDDKSPHANGAAAE